jgi:hypothetical protein
MYGKSDYEDDVKATARVLHLAFRRGQFLLARWNSGLNVAFPDKTHPELNAFMAHVASMVDDYQAKDSAKLNVVLPFSDLQLPKDTE